MEILQTSGFNDWLCNTLNSAFRIPHSALETIPHSQLPMILAIIQHLPKNPRRVVRTDSFARFQAICGMIEQESYLAAHASCHATMNGMNRTLACDADISDKASITQAIDAIFEAGPFDALVLPGLTDFELQKFVCECCQNHVAAFEFRLFLDPAKSLDVREIIKHQKALPRFASYCWPWISTVTPGRRSAELLPPSCLIAPLALGCATWLKGVHDWEGLSQDDACDLSECDVEVMTQKTINRRPVIGRFAPLRPVVQPRPMQEFVDVPGVYPNADDEDRDEGDKSSLETAIQEELHAKCDTLIKQYPKNDASLWSALQRTAISVLNGYQSRGLIKAYHVRCDAETASWGTAEAPVVEVLVEYPKRVREIRFCVK